MALNLGPELVLLLVRLEAPFVFLEQTLLPELLRVVVPRAPQRGNLLGVAGCIRAGRAADFFFFFRESGFGREEEVSRLRVPSGLGVKRD